jgi:uncharacterized protein YecE (DUF72 family)
MRSQEVDVYGYFNNHYAGHSPSSLQQFMALYQARSEDSQEDVIDLATFEHRTE